MTKLGNLWRSPANKFLLMNILFISFVFIHGFKMNAFRKNASINDVAFYNGQSLTLIARVCEEADTNYKSRRLTVCAYGKISGKILVTSNLYPEYNYGDFIKLTGELESPPLVDGFDYDTYLARYDIYSVMYYPKIILTNGKLSPAQDVYLGLMKIKWRLKELIDSNLPEPEAGLADALLLGYKRTLLREDFDIFSRVGLSHMIAISGSHITILSAMIINFLIVSGVSRRRALRIIFFFLFLYPLITGLSASAVRSSIMGALAFMAAYYERSSSLTRALVFSASLMLLFNPKILRDDIGFQLSFLALLGIIYIFPIGEGIASRILDRKKLKMKTRNMFKIILDTLNLSIISQMVILPIALINFKQLSLIAPLANVLVLWTFPPLLASLIIAILLSLALPGLSVLWFSPSYFLLKYIFVLSDILAQTSWAAVNIYSFNWYLGLAYYLLLIGFLFLTKFARRFTIVK